MHMHVPFTSCSLGIKDGSSLLLFLGLYLHCSTCHAPTTIILLPPVPSLPVHCLCLRCPSLVVNILSLLQTSNPCRCVALVIEAMPLSMTYSYHHHLVLGVDALPLPLLLDDVFLNEYHTYMLSPLEPHLATISAMRNVDAKMAQALVHLWWARNVIPLSPSHIYLRLGFWRHHYIFLFCLSNCCHLAIILSWPALLDQGILLIVTTIAHVRIQGFPYGP